MEYLKELNKSKSTKDLADLLGYKASTVSYIVYKIAQKDKYTTFSIPKSSVGFRMIDVPEPRLKKLQSALAELLQRCRHERDLDLGLKKHSQFHSHGVRQGSSILTHARRHNKKRYVFNVDIENFFPSINFGRVRGFFLANKHFKTSEQTATLIAQIACNENSLPQGSPLSPIIADLIAEILDIRLTKLSKRHGVYYTRYFDDLTFSSRKIEFPQPIARQNSVRDGFWQPGNQLASTIERAGFSINPNKTRMHIRGNRQLVTGLAVNSKTNIVAEKYRQARSMCHSLFFDGTCHINGEEASISQINGLLSHIFYVKKSTQESILPTRDDKYTGISRLYREFLKYSLFASCEYPMIICEGKTDKVYLLSATKKLNEKFPRLGTFSDSKFKKNYRFFNHSSQAAKILKITGGSSTLKPLFWRNWYEKSLKKFKGASKNNPVIVIVDNDGGASTIFNTIKDNYGITIEIASDEKFFHITENLYLIKTPHIDSKTSTCIEDMFPKEVLDLKIDGKKFSKSDSIDKDTEYGKHIFAESIVKKRWQSIDFSGFETLLHRIEAVIEDYESKVVFRSKNSNS